MQYLIGVKSNMTWQLIEADMLRGTGTILVQDTDIMRKYHGE